MYRYLSASVTTVQNILSCLSCDVLLDGCDLKATTLYSVLCVSSLGKVRSIRPRIYVTMVKLASAINQALRSSLLLCLMVGSIPYSVLRTTKLSDNLDSLGLCVREAEWLSASPLTALHSLYGGCQATLNPQLWRAMAFSPLNRPISTWWRENTACGEQPVSTRVPVVSQIYPFSETVP